MSDSTKIWMPFYPADYLADTQHLNTEMHGAYLLLLLAYWTRQGPLRDSDAELAQICRLPIRRWLAARPTLAAFFDIHEGLWVQNRCEREMANSAHRRQVAKDRSRKGIEARWGNKKESRKDASSIPQALPGVSQIDASSSSSSSSEENSPPPPPSPEASPDDSTGFGGAGQGGASRSIQQVEAIWAIWPKKVDTLQAQTAIDLAIRRHGFEAVLEGTRKIVAADSRRKASPPGRFLPKPVEFFEGGRYLDDSAQYGPREVSADVQTLRRQLEELKAQIQEHPGNPGNTEGSIERKREAAEEFRALCAELNALKRRLAELSSDEGEP